MIEVHIKGILNGVKIETVLDASRDRHGKVHASYTNNGEIRIYDCTVVIDGTTHLVKTIPHSLYSGVNVLELEILE